MRSQQNQIVTTTTNSTAFMNHKSKLFDPEMSDTNLLFWQVTGQQEAASLAEETDFIKRLNQN